MADHIDQIERAIEALRSIDTFALDQCDRERISRAIRILRLELETMKQEC